MRSASPVAFLVLASTAAAANAQQECVAPKTATVSQGNPVVGSGSYTGVAIGRRGSNAITDRRPVNASYTGEWSPSGPEMDIIASVTSQPGGDDAVLIWFTQANPTGCFSAISVVSAASAVVPPPPSATTAPPAETGECNSQRETWESELRERQRSGSMTVLVFDENGELCSWNRDYGVAGDPIFVGILTPVLTDVDGRSLRVRWSPVRFENCALEPEGPRVFVGAGSFADVLSARQSDQRVLLKSSPRRCFNSGVTIVLRKLSPAAAEFRYPLAQYQRYDATLQFGTVFTRLHDHDFGLRPVGADQVIVDRGPAGRGAEYVVSVVLYALPRQLEQMFQRFQGRDVPRGRDIVHDNSLFDRLGGQMGVSLSHPGRRFVAGLTFELFRGVSVSYAREFARVRSLNGVAVGDVFTLPAEQIPTGDAWESAWVWGASIDLRYVTALFGRK